MKKNSKKDNEKSKKVSDFINAFKEAWGNPRKKAGIKLLGYMLFFIIFFIIASIGSGMSTNNLYETENNTTTTTTTTVDTEAYSYKQKLLLENKHFVNYVIKINEETYKINGSINQGILEGYLETNDSIKKVKLENGLLYEVASTQNIVLENNLNVKLIDINSIIKMIMRSRAYIEELDGVKTYSYNIETQDEKYNIKVYTNEDSIYKMEIISDIFNYNLNFDI